MSYILNSEVPPNIVSTANSTTTLLTAGATFTGEWESVLDYTTVATAVLGSMATDGTLYFDLSTDSGATYASVPNTVADTTFNVPRILNVVETYVRIRYVNGTTNQTGSFSIQTKYSNGQSMDLLSSTDGLIRGETPATTVKVVNTPLEDRNQGFHLGQEQKRKFGVNESVGTVLETVWSYTADWIPNQIVNQKLRIKAGGNAADTATGLGARNVAITYLDENWLEVEETIATNGASASIDSTSNCVRLIRAEVVQVGAYHVANTAGITFELNGSGNIMGYIGASIGTTEQALTTIPGNKHAYITEIFVSVGQGDSSDIKMFVSHNADDMTAPFQSKQLDWTLEDFSGAQMFKLDTHLKMDAKTDVWFEAKKVTGGGTARVSVDFNYYTVLE